MCGCIPIVMVERGKKREDYLKNDDRVYGVAYGDSKEEIKYAVQTKEKLYNNIFRVLRRPFQPITLELKLV